MTVSGEVIEVETTAGVDRHEPATNGWQITGPSGTVRLGGLRRVTAAASGPLVDMNKPTPTHGTALHVASPPDLGGTSRGSTPALR